MILFCTPPPSPVILFFFFLFAQETKIDCVRVATKGRAGTRCVNKTVAPHITCIWLLKTNKISMFFYLLALFLDLFSPSHLEKKRVLWFNMNFDQYIDPFHGFFHEWEAACVPAEVCRYLNMLPECPAPHIKGDEVWAPLIWKQNW